MKPRQRSVPRDRIEHATPDLRPAGPPTGNGDLSVIDVHQHYIQPGEDEILFGQHEARPGEAYARLELAERLRAMDADGVGQAVIMPGHGYLRPHGIADTRRINNGVTAYQQAHPDRFPVALGIAEPLFGTESLTELDRVHSGLGLAGVSFHARFQGVPTDHRLIIRLIERVTELGMTAFVHAGDSSEEDLWRVLNVARSVPEATVVVLDAFDRFEKANQALACAELAPNLAFDTAGCADIDFILRFAARHGAQRLLFGSCRYSSATPRKRRHILPDLLAAELPDDEKHAIAGGNVAKILGL